MPKPLFMQKQAEQTINTLDLKRKEPVKKQYTEMQMAKILRQRRSKEYMETLHNLDAGGHVHNQEKVSRVLEALSKEFPEVELAGILLGVVAVCYLGKPYEVHMLDFVGNIIEHYKTGEELPQGLERVRGIAIHGGYEYIEVYTDCCRAISADGTVSLIAN
ncbi:hypothetical protein [Selenomonas sp. AB3002]|uniref:hypothetical protein n=1 Tax=Selenomonas sp. AB3002 TaxID=1392502 RepID=UPI0004963696